MFLALVSYPANASGVTNSTTGMWRLVGRMYCPNVTTSTPAQQPRACSPGHASAQKTMASEGTHTCETGKPGRDGCTGSKMDTCSIAGHPAGQTADNHRRPHIAWVHLAASYIFLSCMLGCRIADERQSAHCPQWSSSTRLTIVAELLHCGCDFCWGLSTAQHDGGLGDACACCLRSSQRRQALLPICPPISHNALQAWHLRESPLSSQSCKQLLETFDYVIRNGICLSAAS